MKTDLGRINIEVISFVGYKWIIMAYSGTLIIDGSLQMAMQTPFVNTV